MSLNTNRTDIQKSFLTLVRFGIGTSKDAKIPNDVSWNELKELAERQGLSAVVLDGIERLPEQQRPPKIFLLEWIGETLHGYEYRYDQYSKALSELAGFYNAHGFKMMVLKGYACSLNWPKPSHRPCGDIDIWQFGKQKEADETLQKEHGPNFKIDDSHEHHTVFCWRDFMVENHYDFIDIHHRKSSPQLEAILKELGRDDTHTIDVFGEKIFVPSPNLHAIFLLRHCMEHFASTGLTIRQLLDWAFFVEKHAKEIDWGLLNGVMEEFGMTPAFNIFNAICVEDLGFDMSLFPSQQFSPLVKDRFLNDIFEPEFSGVEPKWFVPRVVYKYRRWKANGWKNKLCFKESMWSAFWSGVWGHILKPASI